MCCRRENETQSLSQPLTGKAKLRHEDGRRGNAGGGDCGKRASAVAAAAMAAAMAAIVPPPPHLAMTAGRLSDAWRN